MHQDGHIFIPLCSEEMYLLAKQTNFCSLEDQLLKEGLKKTKARLKKKTNQLIFIVRKFLIHNRFDLFILPF